MPELKPEYPQGKSTLEIELVKMLTEKRSWHDYCQIGQALWNIRFHADMMKKELDMLSDAEADTGENKPPIGEAQK